MCLYFCWVMICPVTTSRPTQTQGHTHHDTVESVWLGSRSTRQRGGGKKPLTWLMSLSLSLPFFLSLSVCLSITSPVSLSLSPPHVCPSVAFTTPLYCSQISLWTISLLSPCFKQSMLVSYEIAQKLASIHNLASVPFWVNEENFGPLHQQGVHLCKARCVRKIRRPEEQMLLYHPEVLIISNIFISCPYWPVGHAAVAHLHPPPTPAHTHSHTSAPCKRVESNVHVCQTECYTPVWDLGSVRMGDFAELYSVYRRWKLKHLCTQIKVREH